MFQYNKKSDVRYSAPVSDIRFLHITYFSYLANAEYVCFLLIMLVFENIPLKQHMGSASFGSDPMTPPQLPARTVDVPPHLAPDRGVDVSLFQFFLKTQDILPLRPHIIALFDRVDRDQIDMAV